jgi:DNA-binding beta-propeller fold protein YncE
MNPARSLLLAVAATATAQVPPAIPFARTLDLVVVDLTYDGVWRLVDFDQNGDFNGPGETMPYFVNGSSGITFASPTCIAVAHDGTVYVGESSTDFIAAMRDQDGDGDADDPGEARVFFDLSNASLLQLESIQGICVDRLGRVFATDANADRILILEDLNGDGDANDLSEARVYHDVPGTAAGGDSIPTAVLAGLDGNLYFTDNGATGVIPKGVYRLEDLTFDGDCNDPGERTLFWAPTAAASPFLYGLAIDASFRFYLSDHSTNEQVLTAFDADGSGTIQDGKFVFVALGPSNRVAAVDADSFAVKDYILVGQSSMSSTASPRT